MALPLSYITACPVFQVLKSHRTLHQDFVLATNETTEKFNEFLYALPGYYVNFVPKDCGTMFSTRSVGPSHTEKGTFISFEPRFLIEAFSCPCFAMVL